MVVHEALNSSDGSQIECMYVPGINFEEAPEIQYQNPKTSTLEDSRPSLPIFRRLTDYGQSMLSLSRVMTVSK